MGRLFRLLWTLLLAFPAAVSGQTTAPAQPEEMKRLEFLVGEWKGEGWLYRADGSRVKIAQSRKVKPVSDGSALQVEERLQARGGIAGPLFSGSRAATIVYDAAAKQYQWRSNSAEGRKTPDPAQLVGPRIFRWDRQSMAGISRTTVEVTEGGEWRETLEFWNSVDGWFKAQESVLKRVK